MLLGRRRERDWIDALLAQARSGTSGALLVVGEPGMGKSALLADAFARADGLTALSLVVAHGATNRDAAGALFLSPKTIEFHLGHIYRKLGIRSRSQLTRLMAERETNAASGQSRRVARRR